MGKDQKQLDKARQQFNKAELLYKNKDFKKAGKIFDTVGNNFLKLFEFKLAEESFFLAAKSFTNERKYVFALTSYRNAGNICFFVDEFMEAHKYFNSALKIVPRLDNEKERNSNYLLFASLSYLCYLIKALPDQGLALLKQVKKKVDDFYFKEHMFVRLVTDLIVALRDKNKKYLDKVEQDFESYKFTEAEKHLVKRVLLTTRSQISLKTKLTLDKEQYTTKDLMKIGLTIDAKPLLAISKHPFHEYEIEELKITKINVIHSDNLSTVEKPSLPIIIEPGQQKQVELVIKPNFQIDDNFIGPIIMSCELDEKYDFFLETRVIIPKLISPLPTLDFSTRNLRPPLIDKSFPFEILISNKSDGEALDIKIDIEFPEQLKVMRGTTVKQIYSLKTNDSMTWELQLKPLEAGDFTIKMNVSFKDPDQNLIEYVKDFPFSIKL